MSTNIKEKLLLQVTNTCSAIKSGRAISRHGIGSQIHISITFGPFHKLNLACDRGSIIGVRGFRACASDGTIDIINKNWEKAWGCVPQNQKDQLTGFLKSNCNDIEVRIVHMVYYKGIPVGQRLNQGQSKGKVASFPRELNNNNFDTSKKAQSSAMRLGAYIKGLEEKKGNRNFK